MNNPNLECDDTMNDIKKKSENGTSNDTMTRRCPSCDKELSYGSLRAFRQAVRLIRCCISCSKKKLESLKPPKKLTRSCPNCDKVLFYTRTDLVKRANERGAVCKSCSLKLNPQRFKKLIELSKKQPSGIHSPHFGKKHSSETRQKMSRSQKLINRSHIKMSEKTKIKLRKYRCEWILNNGGGPQFNPAACNYISSLSKIKGWNLTHALNGGEHYIKELGYWVDGYDKDRNIVVEYDEPKHYTVSGELKPKDVVRQNLIIEYLKCKFLRYNERRNQLYEVTKTI